MNRSGDARPNTAVFIAVFVCLAMGLVVGYLVGVPIGIDKGHLTGHDAGWNDCLAAQAKGPAAIWRNPSDGTVLVYRDFTGSTIKPNWDRLYDTLVQGDTGKVRRVVGKTVEIQLRGKVPGQVMGRLALKTNTGWIIQVQLNDVPFEKWKNFVNSSMVVSAGVIHGKPIESATKVALAGVTSPESFRD